MKRILAILLLASSAFAADYVVTVSVITNSGVVTETKNVTAVPAGYVLRRNTNDTGFEAVPASTLMTTTPLFTTNTVATTGAISVPMNQAIITITPTAACTLNATGGLLGQTVTIKVTTSGVSAFVLTFGTNFKSQGTLSTGTTTAKIFCVRFQYDGATWLEIARTTAM